MGKMITYKCKITGYSVDFDVDYENKKATIEYINTDYKHVKPFLILMRSSIDSLKEGGITHIVQGVLKDDWENHLKGKTDWMVTDSFNEGVTLECSIDSFLKNFATGIGL